MRNRRKLGRALSQQDLVIHYQPIVDPRDGRAISVEALLRGRDDDQRELNISDITSSAERTEEIFELDRWIMNQAFEDAAGWQKRGLPRLALNLNLSAREFHNRQFVPTLDKAARAKGIEPALVHLEITETASIFDPAEAEAVMTRLQQRGYRIWLDDFGTGHSSLEWLKWFSVYGVKIPRSFVGDLLSNRRSEAIASAICRLAGELKTRIAAEGVENRKQLTRLRAMGITLAQGFLFYRALSPEELETTLLSVESKQSRVPGRPTRRRS